MRRNSKALITAVVSGALVLTGATAAFATTVNPPEGGTWTYNSVGVNLSSNYYHPSRAHGSSVENCFGAITRSATVGAGVTSKASATNGCLAPLIDYAYYRVS